MINIASIEFHKTVYSFLIDFKEIEFSKKQNGQTIFILNYILLKNIMVQKPELY